MILENPSRFSKMNLTLLVLFVCKLVELDCHVCCQVLGLMETRPLAYSCSSSDRREGRSSTENRCLSHGSPTWHGWASLQRVSHLLRLSRSYTHTCSSSIVFTSCCLNVSLRKLRKINTILFKRLGSVHKS